MIFSSLAFFAPAFVAVFLAAVCFFFSSDICEACDLVFLLFCLFLGETSQLLFGLFWGVECFETVSHCVVTFFSYLSCLGDPFVAVEIVARFLCVVRIVVHKAVEEVCICVIFL
ncbi:hypothetical protein MEG_01786 [Bartonella tamiae Th307]|nr:hypothetical protein MEG_01786 [Bartonella tamiae Th307]